MIDDLSIDLSCGRLVDYLIHRSIDHLIMHSATTDLGGTHGRARGSRCSNISVFAGGTLRRNTSRLSPGPHIEGLYVEHCSF